MPIFEGYCNNDTCSRYKRQVEFLLKNHTLPNKPCPECKTPVNRLVGKPNVIWAKPLGWYQGETDRGEKSEGHWVCGEDSGGNKYRKFITTRQEQLAYCRENGICDPMENARTRGLNDRGIDEAGKVHTWDTTPATMVAGIKKDDTWI
jgi:hypothetical protein